MDSFNDRHAEERRRAVSPHADATPISHTLRDPDTLIGAGLAAEASRAAIDRVTARYAVAITPAMVALIDAADPADPIARQFVPAAAELDTTPEERADPIGDVAHSPLEGIVHRYPDRVLLAPVHVCAVYCRFCFRRETVGPASRPLSRDKLAAAFDYIRQHRDIWEVILTGGDPLVMSPRRLRAIMAALAGIDHVRVIRLHTRVPAVAPERITAAIVAALKPAAKAVYVVLHANHPRELTPEARAACGRLVDAGIPMLGQSVLLAGINDDPSTLEALMRALVETRVKPYYLHHPDLAPGTRAMRLPIGRGQDLVRGLRGRVSGLCQPSYVLDIPGGHGKSPIGPAFLTQTGRGCYEIEDYRGGRHAYTTEADADDKDKRS